MAEAATGESPPAAEHPLELSEALGWVGFKLDEMGGATAGRIEGVFVDAGSGEPVWLVIRIGRFGRRSAVPFNLAAGGVGRVWVPYEREVIRKAREVDPAAGLDADRELALCEHYGIPEGAEPRRRLKGREGEAGTAVPAEG